MATDPCHNWRDDSIEENDWKVKREVIDVSLGDPVLPSALDGQFGDTEDVLNVPTSRHDETHAEDAESIASTPTIQMSFRTNLVGSNISSGEHFARMDSHVYPDDEQQLADPSTYVDPDSLSLLLMIELMTDQELSKADGSASQEHDAVSIEAESTKAGPAAIQNAVAGIHSANPEDKLDSVLAAETALAETAHSESADMASDVYVEASPEPVDKSAMDLYEEMFEPFPDTGPGSSISADIIAASFELSRPMAGLDIGVSEASYTATRGVSRESEDLPASDQSASGSFFPAEDLTMDYGAECDGDAGYGARSPRAEFGNVPAPDIPVPKSIEDIQSEALLDDQDDSNHSEQVPILRKATKAGGTRRKAKASERLSESDIPVQPREILRADRTDAGLLLRQLDVRHEDSVRCRWCQWLRIR